MSTCNGPIIIVSTNQCPRVHISEPIRKDLATGNMDFNQVQIPQPIKIILEFLTLDLMAIPSPKLAPLILSCLTSLITTSITLHCLPDQLTRVHMIEGQDKLKVKGKIARQDTYTLLVHDTSSYKLTVRLKTTTTKNS